LAWCSRFSTGGHDWIEVHLLVTETVNDISSIQKKLALGLSLDRKATDAMLDGEFVRSEDVQDGEGASRSLDAEPLEIFRSLLVWGRWQTTGCLRWKTPKPGFALHGAT
jgi:hypothetical protein